MNKTLAIIGSHPRTRELFDFTRTDCDIWLFNEAISNKDNAWAKRADAIFQMHVPAIWKNPRNRNDPHHYEWLQTQTDCVVWMQDAYPEVPRAKRYPLEAILDMIGNPPDHFLTSSVPQAMALAAYLGQYTRVEIYGVAMETNTEYQFQREGVAFWLGFLKGRGVDTYFADPTFIAPMYGYEGEVAIKYEQFVERIGQLTPKMQDIRLAYKQAEAEASKALAAYELDGSADHERNLFETNAKAIQILEQVGQIHGAIQENEKYKSKADTMRDASGGEFIFSRQEFESSAKALGDAVSRGMMDLNSIQTTLDIIHNNTKRAAKGSPKFQKIMEGYRLKLVEYLRRTEEVNVWKGAAMENYAFMQYLDRHIRAAGGSKSEEAILESMRSNEQMVGA